MKALIMPQWVSSHFVWLFKVRLVLDLLQDLMHWFLEHSVNHLRDRRSRLSSKIPLGSVIVVFVRLEIPPLLRDNLTLRFAFLLVFLDLLVLINAIHKLTNTPYWLLSQGFFKSCSVGNLTLKVLMATSSKSPSISLNISQYLSKYVFRVSLAWTCTRESLRAEEPYYT